MKTRLSIDIETFSESDLTKVGAAAYAEHPSTEVIVISYTYGEAEPCSWVPGDSKPEWMHTPDDYTFCAWNAAFEFNVLSRKIAHLVTLPPLHEWHDTMLVAASYSLPHALGQCAFALGMKEQKDADGHNLMMKMCKPNSKGERVTSPEQVKRLTEYCEQDVRAERAIANKLPPLVTGFEREVYEVTAIINQRGVLIDVDAAEAVKTLYEPERLRIVDELVAITGLENPNSTQQMMGWVTEQGYDLPNCQAATFREILEEDEDLSDELRNAFELKTTLSKAATKKYDAMTRRVNSDNRVRDSFTYHGAHTGRYASRGINVQNLHRPTFGDDVDPSYVMDMVVNYPGAVKGMYDITELACNLERSVIISPEGSTLLVSDYSAIEARVLAWLANQLDILEVFEGDGKLYEYTASKIYRINKEDVDKEQRFIGKVASLALGFQGAEGAFARMAKAYGLKDVDPKLARKVKTEWRDANTNIVAFWRRLQDTAIDAVANPGRICRIRNRIAMVFAHGRLQVRLPSGRILNYWSPEIREKTVKIRDYETGEVTDSFDTEAVTYLGLNSVTRKWGRMDTYGGKLCENVTQAVARDLLVHAMVNLEKAGYPIVLHVHDEIIAEVEDDSGLTLAGMEAIMCELPEWAVGLPIDAEGFETTRYKKG